MFCIRITIFLLCQVPKTEVGWKQVAQEFKEQWNLHNCIDGKHINPKTPNSGSYYYKGSFSIVVMAIFNGGVSDGGVQNMGVRRANFSLLLYVKNLDGCSFYLRIERSPLP